MGRAFPTPTDRSWDCAGLVDGVRDLTDRETSCCSFFTFGIAGTDDGLTLDIAVPPARREILETLADRAAELAS